MARTEIPIVVVQGTRPVAGASVQINNRGGGAATVYLAETGATTTPNPLTTDAFGRVNGWLDRGAYDGLISSVITGSYTESFDSVPGADGSVDTAWLANLAVSTPKLADAAVTSVKIGNSQVTVAHLVQAILDMMVPIGVILPFVSNTAPNANYVLADGSNASIATYPALDALIGAAAPAGFTHAFNGGASPGAGLFKLPPVPGRSIMGAGSGAGLTVRAFAALLGAETQVLGQNHLPPHSHTNPNISFSTSAIGESAGMYHRWGAWDIAVGDATGSNGAYAVGQGGTGNGPGTSTGVPIVQPSLALYHIIRAK